MTRAQISTPWTGTGTRRDPYRPKLGDDYHLLSFTDLTGGTPTTNPTFTVQADIDDGVFAQIQADPRYTVLSFTKVA